MFTWTIILSTKEGHTQLTLRGLARALAPRGCDERDARALLLRDAGVDGGRREGWHERLRPAAAMSMSPCEIRQFIVLCSSCEDFLSRSTCFSRCFC